MHQAERVNVVVPASSCEHGPMNVYTQEDWKRLGLVITEARIRRGFSTAKELAEAVTVTPRVIGDLENGRRDNYSAATMINLERVLGWESGSVYMVLGGGQPVQRISREKPERSVLQRESEHVARVHLELSQESSDELVRGIQQRVDELRRRVESADRLLIKHVPLPPPVSDYRNEYGLVADDNPDYELEDYANQEEP